MARPWRIQFPDAIYHVTARGNNRQAIFLLDSDRHDFLLLLARASDRFGLQLFAFCLMTNHYHLFLRTPDANLAASLQWLNATYTARFHRRHRRNGHLFQGRYKSVLVTDEAHWFHLSMYLHLNPIRARLVDDPADYQWSSFRDYTRPTSRFPWLDRSTILSSYSPQETAARRFYRKECLSLSEKKPKFWEDWRNRVVLGSEEVLAELVKKYPPAGRAEAVPAFRRAARPPVEVQAELVQVSRALGQVGEGRKKRGDLPVRLAAYYHLVEQRGMSLTKVGAAMGVSVYAVSKGLARFRQRLAEDKDLRDKIKAMSNVQL